MKKKHLILNTSPAFAVFLRSLGAGFCLCLIPALATGQAVPATPPSSGEETQKLPTSPEIQQLPSFVVSEVQDQGYMAANSISATSINTPIMDLPFAMSAFTPAFIEDTGATDLLDIGKYAAGVRIGGTEFTNGSTRWDVRGFDQYPEQDGVYGGPQSNLYVDLQATERVEVVKGPASLLYGQINPGGTINYITKQAGPTPSSTVSITGGSLNYGRVSIDINQPVISDTLFFRFNAAFETDYQWSDPGHTKFELIDPTATWKIAKNLSLRVNYQYFKRSETPQSTYLPSSELGTPDSIVAAFNPASGYRSPVDPLYGAIGKSLSGYGSVDIDEGYNDSSNPTVVESQFFTYPNKFNYSSANDQRITRLGTLNTELDATIGEHWTVKGNFDYNSNSDDQTQTGYGGLFIPAPNTMVFSDGGWSVAPSWLAMSPSQQLADYAKWAGEENNNPAKAILGDTENGTPAPWINTRRPLYTEQGGHTVTYQFEAVGSYNIGDWGTIKPLVGIYANQDYASRFYVKAVGDPANPWFKTWDLDPRSPTYFIDYNTTVNTADLLNPPQINNLEYSGDEAAYGILNCSFLQDRLFIVAGARYNVSDTNTIDHTNPSDPYGVGYRSHYTTPQLGIGFKIVKDVLLYASYSTSYTLPANTALQGVKYPNGPTAPPVEYVVSQSKPTVGEGYEVGIKTDFLNGRISSTLTAYQDTQKEVVTEVDPILNGVVAAIDFQGAEQVAQGVEYELTYSPYNNLQFFVSFTDSQCELADEPVGYTYYNGEWPADYSRLMSNLWARYSLATGPFKGLWIGGGYNYNSKSQALDQINKYAFMPSIFEWNSALGYDFVWDHRKMKFVINWYDMTNKFVIPAEQEAGMGGHASASLTCTF